MLYDHLTLFLIIIPSQVTTFRSYLSISNCFLIKRIQISDFPFVISLLFLFHLSNQICA